MPRQLSINMPMTYNILTMGCTAQSPSVYPVDSQLASRNWPNSEDTRPAAAMTSIESALEMKSPISIA